MIKTLLIAFCFLLASSNVNFAKSPSPITNENQIGFAYLSVIVKGKGRSKEFKTPNISGSHASMKKNIQRYIKKYVPNDAHTQCKLVFTQNKINKNYSGKELSKNVTGDGATIHKNIRQVVGNLL